MAKKIELDIIHANIIFPIAIIAIVLSKRLNIPLLITEHWTGYTEEDKDNLSAFKLLFVKWIVKRSSFIITVSGNLMHSMQKLGIKGRYRVIPNVVNENLFTLRRKKSNNIIRFIHVSTLNDKQKNISGILRSAKLLYERRSDFYIQILGNGDFSSYIRLRDSWGLKDVISIEGEKTIEEVAESMKQSDVFLLFSNYENSPCVISEALCIGLPVISTDVGGVKEMINDTNGMLVESKNENMLCDKMEYVIENYDKYDNRKIRKEAVLRFGYYNVSKQINNLYEQIIKID